MTEPRNRRAEDLKNLEDKADIAQAHALERHVAMRLTAIIKAEEARKRATRNWIIAGVTVFVLMVLGGLIFVVVNLSIVAERQRLDAEQTKQTLYDACLGRNEQALSVKNLVGNLTAPRTAPTVPVTPEQQKRTEKTVESLLAFERAFAKTTDCEAFLVSPE